MQFLSRTPRPINRLGILPGTFNPLTQAHIALAEAALAELDEVVLALPQAFPHKNYSGADFMQRATMLRAAIATETHVSAASTQGGLFVEIAQECRAVFGETVELVFVCGRDAAERIVSWDYGDPRAIERMLESFRMLVASRDGSYEPPAHLSRHIRVLTVSTDLSGISASEVRRRIREGLAWEHLVPPAIVPMVREIYRPLE